MQKCISVTNEALMGIHKNVKHWMQKFMSVTNEAFMGIHKTLMHELVWQK